MVVCLGVVVILSVLMSNAHRDDGGDRSGSWLEDAIAVITDERVAVAPDTRAGEDVGRGTVVAMDPAPEEEQVRTAEQLEGATKMVNAFLNISHEDVEANIEAVKALATGQFLRQYTRASQDLAKLTRRAQATQTGEAVWVGLVAGDDDDATVIAATSGTVTNELTDFEPQARTYRLQLDLDLVDGEWLTSDLQYVE
ncbi:hypothetical protein [Nocardioides bizhenqiangii]|uniref:Mce-associated membrane protein n=1 Tax=Nocardioides bizhenqiangii TaxID=3095076 RepID=A0ABZ0ZKH4_9ACTN|nr:MULTISPECIES: hypothetical protein [unclassified Nocardioides]MDZ5620484.1 hypothetical protein [Nocardioides sp. HM23]WQQ24852.1 hypothetical protein SHK19_12830 [Nocardioides sp. HM61]